MFLAARRGSPWQNLAMRRRRFILPSAVACASTALLALACITDYQKGVDDPDFGAPNALAGQKQPGSSTDVAPVGADGGGGSTTSVNVVCVTSGGTLLEAGAPCAVSFEKDVLPALGRSTCAQTACHGGASPPTPPRIEPGDPKGMWDEFAGFKMNGGMPYINPCSTDKTKAGLACNLYATGACGVKMPSGGQPQMPQEDIDKIDAWLECGSPNN
jgi:hypothetical protein